MKLSQEEADTFSPIHCIAGFYGGEDSGKCCKNLANVSDFLIFTVLLATVYQLMTSSSEYKDTLSVSFVVCIAYTLALYYSACFRIQFKDFCNLHSLIKSTRYSFSEMLGEPSISKDFRSDLKHSNRYVYFGLMASFISAFLFSIQPFMRSAGVFGMDGSRRLQIDMWCPFDYQTSFVFEFMVLVQFITVFWVALRFFANEAFYMYTIMANVRLFKYLAACAEKVMNFDESGEKTPKREFETKQTFKNKLNSSVWRRYLQRDRSDRKENTFTFSEVELENVSVLNKQSPKHTQTEKILTKDNISIFGKIRKKMQIFKHGKTVNCKELPLIKVSEISKVKEVISREVDGEPQEENKPENLQTFEEQHRLFVNKEFSDQAGRRLKIFIKHHQVILLCAKRTCHLYGFALLMYLQSLMGFASVGAFGVLHTNGFQGPQTIAVSFFSIANVICMYFMCVACDNLSEHSESAANCFFSQPWYICSKEFRSSLVLVLQRFNTRVQPHVVGLSTFPLNCVTFIWFLKTVLSLYLFLVQVQRLKKN